MDRTTAMLCAQPRKEMAASVTYTEKHINRNDIQLANANQANRKSIKKRKSVGFFYTKISHP